MGCSPALLWAGWVVPRANPLQPRRCCPFGQCLPAYYSLEAYRSSFKVYGMLHFFNIHSSCPELFKQCISQQLCLPPHKKSPKAVTAPNPLASVSVVEPRLQGPLQGPLQDLLHLLHTRHPLGCGCWVACICASWRLSSSGEHSSG